MWFLVLKKDLPEVWQLGFQDAASPAMEKILFFHEEVMCLLTLIIIFVL